MDMTALVILALGVLGFGLVSGRLQGSMMTPPIAFTTLGVGAAMMGAAHVEVPAGAIHFLAELTLVVVLFTDAARIDMRLLRREHDLPVRLLLIGMPLTILAGTGAAHLLFPHWTPWQMALLAAVLAPTDAALGQAVVSSPKVPVRIRQTLNVESGLNDGIALPLVLLFLSACASAQPDAGGADYWLRFAAMQVTFGPLVGVLVGWLGGRAVEAARRNGWTTGPFVRLSSLGLALLAFAGAESVHGNGFIAAFVAGLTLGNTCKGLWHSLEDFAETEGQLMTLLVFVLFGALMLPEHSAHIGLRHVVYGVLSLTLIRMVPVTLALLGAGLRPATVGFLGWFGPRGIASLLFGLLVVEDSVLPDRHDVFAVVLVTVLLSVVLHGMTAAPGSEWYARHTEKMDREMAEHQPVSEMPVRLRHDAGA